MTISTLIGPWALVAAGVCFMLYVASVVRREGRGARTRITTLADSRPLSTTSIVLAVVVGAALLALRLGVMS